MVTLPVSASEAHSRWRTCANTAAMVQALQAVVQLRAATAPHALIEVGLVDRLWLHAARRGAGDDVIPPGRAMCRSGRGRGGPVGHHRRPRPRCAACSPPARRGWAQAGAAHMHKTRGLAYNRPPPTTWACARSTPAGGLGGCPYAPGASGNVVTEDLVFMFKPWASPPAWTTTCTDVCTALSAGPPDEPLYGMTPGRSAHQGWQPAARPSQALTETAFGHHRPAPAPPPGTTCNNFVRARLAAHSRYADVLARGAGTSSPVLYTCSNLPSAAGAAGDGGVARGSCGQLYEEIGDIDTAAAPLLALWLVRCDGPGTGSSFCRAYPPRGGGPVCSPGQHPPAPTHTADQGRAAANLQPHHTNCLTLSPMAPHQHRSRVACGARGDGAVHRLRLMFFGNLHQSWSEFILADLGLFEYEVVPFDSAIEGVSNAAPMWDHPRLHAAARQALDDGAERPPLPAAHQCKPPAPTWLERRRAKLPDAPGRGLRKAADWPPVEQAHGPQHPAHGTGASAVIERMGRHADAALALAPRPRPPRKR